MNNHTLEVFSQFTLENQFGYVMLIMGAVMIAAGLMTAIVTQIVAPLIGERQADRFHHHLLNVVCLGAALAFSPVMSILFMAFNNGDTLTATSLNQVGLMLATLIASFSIYSSISVERRHKETEPSK